MSDKALKTSDKALLVMDMPEKCIECPMLNSIDECILQSEDQNFEADTFDDLKSGCPLKPMPEKKIECEFKSCSKKCCDHGRNACIDKIMEGESCTD